jgi:hypothetical protein
LFPVTLAIPIGCISEYSVACIRIDYVKDPVNSLLAGNAEHFKLKKSKRKPKIDEASPMLKAEILS